MRNTGGLVASGADELNIGSMKGHFFRDDAALGDFEGGFGVTFDFIDTFDDDFGGVGESGNDFALFTLILTGEDLNVIALFDMKFNERHDITTLKDFGREGNDFHEIFIAEFTSDGTENTSAARGFIVFDDDGGIVVEADIGTVLTAESLF